MTPALVSRRLALDTLILLYKQRIPTEKAMARAQSAFEKEGGSPVPPADKRLAQALVAVCLRYHGVFNSWIDANTPKPLPEEAPARFLLQIGMAQLFTLEGIPPHAALDTTVELAKQLDGGHQAKFINAVLRNLQRQNPGNPADHASLSVPHWLKHTLKSDYGSASHQIMRAMLQEASLTLRARLGATPALEEATPLPLKGAFTWHKSITELLQSALWQEGKLVVQDAAAQLPAPILAHFYRAADRHGAVLDMCAAPGGKSIQLADLLPQSRHVALDVAPQRINQMQENFDRCHTTVETVCADGQKTPFASGSFAAILLDAPCSSTGTTRRHPDIFLLKQRNDVPQAVRLQKALLHEADRLLEAGGILVYATCSLLKDENEHQIEQFLKDHPQYTRHAIPARFALQAENCDEDGALRLFPTAFNDGFYMTVLEKARA